MRLFLTMATIAVLPLSVLTACESNRSMDRSMDRNMDNRMSRSGSASPAAGRFTSADQERTMVNEMNLHRAGDQSGMTASERDNQALRRTIAGQSQRSQTTQVASGTTNEMGIGKGMPQTGQGGMQRGMGQRPYDQPSGMREETIVIVPVEPRSSSDVTDIGRYEPDFRQDYQNNFSNSGYGYDQYRPAYRYGFEMASDPRYGNADWSDIERQAHRNWDEGTMGPWDRYKDAVRYGWERGRQAAQGRS